MTIADWLSHGHNVRHKVFPLKLEGPEVGAHTAESHLDFVRNENTPRLVYMAEGFASVCTGVEVHLGFQVNGEKENSEHKHIV